MLREDGKKDYTKQQANIEKSSIYNKLEKDRGKDWKEILVPKEINPRLPLLTSGISDAKNTLRIMETAPIVIVVLNTNGKSPFIQLDADDRLTEMNDLLSIGASIENMLLKAELVGEIALGYKAGTPSMRPRKKTEDIVTYFD